MEKDICNGSVIMKKILFISFFSIIVIMYPLKKEITLDKNNKCGFNINERHSIIVEGNNKCFYYNRPIKKEKNLMIVAHPDDESIWGGGHLLQEDYVVVCITCGTVDYRTEEFKRIMELTGDEYMMLGYPDLTGYYIDRWDSCYNDILNDLKSIVDSRNWNSIVTHNPDGEYGHIQHRMTSDITTSVADKDKLYYFGRYYTSDYIPDMPTLDTNTYNRKMDELISVYVSQPIAMSRHRHMMIYENFVKYNEW